MNNLRIDEIGFGGIKLLQDKEQFCFGLDAVLLADFAKAFPSYKVLELGSGNGAASFISYAKYHPKKIYGIELQEESFNLSQESKKLNNISEEIEFLNCDLLNLEQIFPAESFDLVMSNPPYMEKGSAITCKNSVKSLARHESTASFSDFASMAARLLKPFGSFFIVHRPFRLPDIFESLRKFSLEPKKLQFVAPKENTSPNLFLLEAQKNAGKELKMLPQLIVRNEDGSFTKELLAIYGKEIQ